jgi:MFS family permease
LTLLVLSGAFYVGTSGQLAWIAVLSVAAYVGFFAIGLGPVFWLLIAEIFPLALRGRAMSLATVANWSFNLIVSATFLNLVGAVGSAGAFLSKPSWLLRDCQDISCDLPGVVRQAAEVFRRFGQIQRRTRGCR